MYEYFFLGMLCGFALVAFVIFALAIIYVILTIDDKEQDDEQFNS